jgi:hypothetical protein
MFFKDFSLREALEVEQNKVGWSRCSDLLAACILFLRRERGDSFATAGETEMLLDNPDYAIDVVRGYGEGDTVNAYAYGFAQGKGILTPELWARQIINRCRGEVVSDEGYDVLERVLHHYDVDEIVANATQRI